MTTQVQEQEFVAQSPVERIDAPHLTDAERETLLDCINAVRSGEKQFQVLLTNLKVRDSQGNYVHGPKREAGRDYDPHEALAPHAHLGWLTRAGVNKKTGKVYVYVYDEARAQAGENGHTNVTMEGIRSFKVLSERPGPLARLEQQPQPQGFPQGFQGFDPRLLMAQAMFLQAQAMIAMGQSLAAQAQQPQPQQT